MTSSETSAHPPFTHEAQAMLGTVWVIIPALNEEKSISFVLSDLPDVGRVIVVDNGSTDRTPMLAVEHGAEVVLEKQRGYGAACLAGLRRVEEHVNQGAVPPRIIVFVDADYSDHPDLLPDLVRPIHEGKFDLVMGSRLLGVREPGAMPPQSVYGNKLACFLMRLCFGARFTDLGPFRAMDYSKLRGIRMRDDNFGWTIEMQIKVARTRLRWLEIPVPYRRRVGVSKISGTVTGTIKAGSKILWTIARHSLSSPPD